MKNNIVCQKSFNFALRIVKAYQYLTITKKEYILSKQLLKSGTSIGANIEEAIGAQSTKDFFTKITISYKENRETHYWLKLLFHSKIITENQFISLNQDCEELLRIIGSIQIKTKKKLSSRNS